MEELTEKELFELFESGAMLHRDSRGHEQMLMNEGTFIAIVKQLIKDNKPNKDIVSVSSLLELMTIHLETREELNHANNATDIYIDGKNDLANEIIKLINNKT